MKRRQEFKKKISIFNYEILSQMYKAVPWLRRLVAGLSPWRPSLLPVQSMWDLWWTKWHWERFFLKFFSFTLSSAFRCGFPDAYISRQTNNRPVSGCSSEISPHHNNNQGDVCGEM
jgi:hypothetical protein